jgi:hypothetical protein
VPGSLFREWKVALAFVAGIALLAGAFVSDEGEHRYFERFKPRKPAAEPVAAAASPAVRPSAGAAQPAPQGGFSTDAELEAAFSEPDAAEAKGEADPDPSASPAASPDAVIAEPGAIQPAAGPAAVQP